MGLFDNPAWRQLEVLLVSAAARNEANIQAQNTKVERMKQILKAQNREFEIYKLDMYDKI